MTKQFSTVSLKDGCWLKYPEYLKIRTDNPLYVFLLNGTKLKFSKNVINNSNNVEEYTIVDICTATVKDGSLYLDNEDIPLNTTCSAYIYPLELKLNKSSSNAVLYYINAITDIVIKIPDTDKYVSVYEYVEHINCNYVPIQSALLE